MQEPAIFVWILLSLYICSNPCLAGDRFKQIKAAVEKGDVDAQLSLAIAFAKGEGTPKNPVEALRWLTKAAENGHVNAQLSLGAAYLYGEGVPQNYIQAYTLFRLAASQDSPEARKTLSILIKKMSPGQIAKGKKKAALLRNKAHGRK